MATIVFDTHRAIQNLKAAGVDDAQAEAMVALVSCVLSKGVARKTDVQSVGQAIQRLEQRMKVEFCSLRSDMQAMEQRANANNRAMEQRIILKLVAILLPCFGFCSILLGGILYLIAPGVKPRMPLAGK